MAVDILPTTLSLVENTYKNTSYENTVEAEEAFTLLRKDITVAAQSVEGQKLIQKFFFMGKTVTTESAFHDMVKIIWRMVKEQEGSPLRKLSFIFICLGTLCSTLPASDKWRNKIESWLGRQLTIGGKGCTGEGEGSVMDRFKRFLSTPYLHDFD